ncbi:hypothetical protein BGV67_04530 [Burkholderia ubonensis]|nr:hypothetical protein BGV67_04530 [Burkholderia ubonensis]
MTSKAARRFDDVEIVVKHFGGEHADWLRIDDDDLQAHAERAREFERLVANSVTPGASLNLEAYTLVAKSLTELEVIDPDGNVLGYVDVNGHYTSSDGRGTLIGEGEPFALGDLFAVIVSERE